MSKPFIFFAFANSSKRYLPNLQSEKDGILDHFFSLKHISKILDYEHRSDTTPDKFYDVISKTSSKINIIHYSGHADDSHFEFESDRYSVKRFCNLLAGINGLKLVFLNGCSTEKMVDLLLAEGVKAVIATTEDVLDIKACDFSVEFYKAICLQGYSLERAFLMAAEKLNITTIDKKKSLISRGNSKRKKTYKKKKKLPWGIYYKEENRNILKWKLVKNGTQENINPSILLELERRETEIIKAKEDKIKIKKTLKLLNRLLKGIKKTDSDYKETEEQIREGEKELNLISEKIDTLSKDRRDFILESVDFDSKAKFKEAVFKLNYSLQRKDFEKLSLEKKIGAFLIQGSPNCGQTFLKDRLMNLSGFNPTLKNILYQKVLLNNDSMSDPTFSVLDIWRKIKEELKLIDSVEPKEMVKELYEKYFKKQKSIIFIFNTINDQTIDFNKSFIEKFWFKFLEYFLTFYKKEDTSRLVLFIIDKSSTFKKVDDKIICEKEQKLLTKISKDKLTNYPTFFLPIITPVTSKELMDWKSTNELPINLGLTKEVLDKVVEKDKGYIQPTINTLCEEVNMLNIYYDIFDHHKTSNL